MTSILKTLKNGTRVFLSARNEGKQAVEEYEKGQAAQRKARAIFTDMAAQHQAIVNRMTRWQRKMYQKASANQPKSIKLAEFYAAMPYGGGE